MNLLTLPELLDLLNYTDDEHLSINTQPVGGAFTSRVVHWQHLPPLADTVNTWHGVNPVRPSTNGRGTAADVTRLAAIWADLDVKPGGCPDMDTAREIIHALSNMLGAAPVAIVASGHGLQPYWAIDPEDGVVTDDNRAKIQTMLRRWGRLVAHVAELWKSQVDSVFDLPRVLRTPGSHNLKSDPVLVIAIPDTGRPLELREIEDTLEAHNVPQMDGDDTTLGDVVSDPDEWEWATTTCGYAKRTLAGWAKDNPTARHPWLTSCYVRLAAMQAHGCLTEHDHQEAKYAVAGRFRQLLTSGEKRTEAPGEIADAYAWGIARAATMPPERIARELGNHKHGEPGYEVDATAPFGRVEGSLATVTALPPPQERPLHAVAERTLNHSDDANALTLVDTYGDRLRHCSDRGRWYAWDGTTWAECPRTSGVAREYAKRVARALPEADTKDIVHKKRSLSAVGISAMLTQAATDDRITVSYDQLDANHWELNTPAGIVDLRTGQTHPSDPTKLHTRTTTCGPDPQADRTVWLKFLTDTFGDDQDLIDFLQRLMGYSATGIVGAHVLPFAHGSGGNGKGVFLEANMKVLGDYATTAPAGFLMSRAHAAHETEIARLSGARMVLCSEVNEDDHFDEAKVKQLTGGDTLTARFMHQDHFTFDPTHKLWLMGNHKPSVKSGGTSFWRRLRLIEFGREVAPENMVDDLQGILAREHGPAILSWIIEGAVKYHRDGLQEPASVLAATQEYAHDQDTVARFVEEKCLLSPVASVTTRVSDVRMAYERWCHENGETPVTAKALGTALAKLDVGSARTKSARMYTGVTLLDSDGDASPNASPNASPHHSEAASDQGW